jgi:hypothetical protein
VQGNGGKITLNVSADETESRRAKHISKLFIFFSDPVF